MRRFINIAALVLLCAASWYGSGLLMAAFSTGKTVEHLRWAFGAFTGIGALAGGMIYKVREAKKAKISDAQQKRIKRVADLIVIRLWVIVLLCMVGPMLGWIASAPLASIDLQDALAQLTLALLLALFVGSLIYLPWLHFDFEAFCDEVAEIERQSERRKEVLARLSDDSTESSKPELRGKAPEGKTPSPKRRHRRSY